MNIFFFFRFYSHLSDHCDCLDLWYYQSNVYFQLSTVVYLVNLLMIVNSENIFSFLSSIYRAFCFILHFFKFIEYFVYLKTVWNRPAIRKHFFFIFWFFNLFISVLILLTFFFEYWFVLKPVFASISNVESLKLFFETSDFSLFDFEHLSTSSCFLSLFPFYLNSKTDFIEFESELVLKLFFKFSCIFRSSSTVM